MQNDFLDSDFAEILEEENLTDAEQRRLENHYAKELEVIKRDDRLDAIAQHIVYHFPRRGFRGKGMVISVDKFTAVKMYDKVSYYWKEEIKKLNTQINKTKDAAEKLRLKDMVDYMHYVRYDTLYTYVLLRVQHWTKAVREDEERLLESILKAGDKERTVAMKKHTAELSKAEKRKAEVDTLFAKMYEDRVSERITEYNFNMLSQKYQMEQIELDEKIQKLKAALAEGKQSVEDARKWIEIFKQYSEPTELTAELLNNMIDKIVVHEAIKYENGFREQKIEIYYRFVGKID